MTFRVEKNKNYTVMSNYHLRDKELSLKAKGLLSWMLSNDDDWDYSIAGIVANCKENETAIISALNELESFGYLVREKLMPESRINPDGTKEVIRSRIEYNYIVYEQPIQHQGFLGIETQATENPPQRNTNKRNTNKEINTIPKGIIVAKAPTDDESISEYESKMYSEDRKINRKVIGEKSQTRKLSLWDKCVQHIEEFTDDESLREALKDYLKLRLAIKDKPIYAAQWKALLNKIPTLKGDPVLIVKQSTELGYASFYDLKTTRPYGGYNKAPNIATFGEHEGMNCNKVTKDDYERMMKNGEKF